MQVIQRVSFYIDGYNFYCGLREKHGRKWLWLNLGALCRSFLRDDQQIAAIHYCTTPIRGDEAQSIRQRTYWEALATIQDLQIHLGVHRPVKRRCRDCRKVLQRFEEKQTDSRIASLMVADAIRDRTDVLVLLAGDSDHIPPVQIVRKECPEKQVHVWWPPARRSKDLASVVHSESYVSDQAIRRNQFPDIVERSDGSLITRPEHWAL